MNEVSHKLADNREYLYNELNSIDALTPYPSEEILFSPDSNMEEKRSIMGQS